MQLQACSQKLFRSARAMSWLDQALAGHGSLGQLVGTVVEGQAMVTALRTGSTAQAHKCGAAHQLAALDHLLRVGQQLCRGTCYCLCSRVVCV